MIAGKWGVNVILGLLVFLLTFLFSLANNTWQTSLMRSGIGFFIFFVLGFLLQLVLHQITISKTTEVKVLEENPPIDEEKVFAKENTTDDASFQPVSLNSLYNGENQSSN